MSLYHLTVFNLRNLWKVQHGLYRPCYHLTRLAKTPVNCATLCLPCKPYRLTGWMVGQYGSIWISYRKSWKCRIVLIVGQVLYNSWGGLRSATWNSCFSILPHLYIYIYIDYWLNHFFCEVFIRPVFIGLSRKSSICRFKYHL